VIHVKIYIANVFILHTSVTCDTYTYFCLQNMILRLLEDSLKTDEAEIVPTWIP